MVDVFFFFQKNKAAFFRQKFILFNTLYTTLPYSLIKENKLTKLNGHLREKRLCIWPVMRNMLFLLLGNTDIRIYDHDKNIVKPLYIRFGTKLLDKVWVFRRD